VISGGPDCYRASHRLLADLIFAREQASYEVATAVAPNASIKRAPDITIFSSKLEVAKYSPDDKRVCIVPNIRVTDSGKKPVSRSEYLDFLVAAAKQVTAAKLKPVLVVHETFGGDAELANEVQRKLGEFEIEIASDSDPKGLKDFIGGSRFVIGSRFHSLVAALSQGVPVIAFGWAHKYPRLLGDFNVLDFNLKSIGDDSNIGSLIDQLIDDATCQTIRQRILAAKETLHLSNKDMWEEVFTTLGLQKN